MKIFYDIYDSIELNLGIKKFLRNYVFTENYLCWLDNNILYPVHSLLNKYFYHRVIFHYGADYHWRDEQSQNLDIEKINFGYGDIHYTFIRNQKPIRILCIGSMFGFIPYMMARACKDNGFGHVDFVDAGYDMKMKGKHFFGQGFWRNINPQNHFKYLGAKPFISTYIMTSLQFAKKYNKRYDYLYFDGDHSYSGALQNFRLFWPKLNTGGLLCLHDIHFDRLLKSLNFQHGRVWKNLSPMPYKIELSNHYSGLGFIQKLGEGNPLDYLRSN